MAASHVQKTTKMLADEDFDYQFESSEKERSVTHNGRTCKIPENMDEFYKEFRNNGTKTNAEDCQANRKNVTFYEVQVISDGNKDRCLPPMYTLGPFNLNKKDSKSGKCETVDEYNAGESCYCFPPEGKLAENKSVECLCNVYLDFNNPNRTKAVSDNNYYRRNCTLSKKEIFTEFPYGDQSIKKNSTKWEADCKLAHEPFDFEKTYFDGIVSTHTAKQIANRVIVSGKESDSKSQQGSKSVTSKEDDFDYAYESVVSHRMVHDNNRSCRISENLDELYNHFKDGQVKTTETDCQAKRKNVTFFEVQVIPGGNENECMPPMYTLGPFNLNKKDSNSGKCETVNEYNAGESCYCFPSGGKLAENTSVQCFCDVYLDLSNPNRTKAVSDHNYYRRSCTLSKKVIFTESPYSDQSIKKNSTKWEADCQLAHKPFDFEKKYFSTSSSTTHDAKNAISEKEKTPGKAKSGNASPIKASKGRSGAKKGSSPAGNSKKKGGKGNKGGASNKRPRINPQSVLVLRTKGNKVLRIQMNPQIQAYLNGRMKHVEGQPKILRLTPREIATVMQLNSQRGRQQNKKGKKVKRSAEFSPEDVIHVSYMSNENMDNSAMELLSSIENKDSLDFSKDLIEPKADVFDNTNEVQNLHRIARDTSNVLGSENLNVNAATYLVPLGLAFAILFSVFSLIKKKMNRKSDS